MRKLLRILFPVAILGASIYLGLHLIKTAPEAERRAVAQSTPLVETVTLSAVEYPMVIQSRGNITPHTQGDLVAEISGRITAVSPNFRPGGFFSAGEVLVTIDSTDYLHAATIARSDLAQARLTLQEESAKASQAEQDWKRMGLVGAPTDLTLHRPQLKKAEASLAAAEARLAQAERDLERTEIVAPYAGRVLEKGADIGQFVTRGATLAALYATDFAEVRLPITDRQATFLRLPDPLGGDSATPATEGPSVNLIASIGTSEYRWSGEVVRSEASIDPRTRQMHVVAQVESPFGRQQDGTPPLRIGQFVKAEIRGKTLHNVFLVPREAVLNGDEILIAGEEQRVQRRSIKTLWQQAEYLIVTSGIRSGEQVIVTPLPYAPEGMKIKIRERVARNP